MRDTMGRPPTHPHRLLMAVDKEFLDAVDAWRAAQPGLPSRSSAIRYLVGVGIKAMAPKPKRKSQPKPRR